MLIILIALFLLFIVLILVSKCYPIMKKVNAILFNIFITFFIFNCFNIAFSLSLHFKYANSQNTLNYTLSTVAAIITLLICIFVLVGFTFFGKIFYGEYRNNFKKSFLTQLYIPITILCRLSIGFAMAYGYNQ